MKKIALATLAGAVVSFTWGFISWMVLTWHNDEMKPFTDEAAVAAVLRANAPAPGYYVMPAPTSLPKNARMDEIAAADEKHKLALNEGPVIYATVRPQPKIHDMNRNLMNAFIRSLVASFLLGILLSMTSSLDYIQRVGLCALVGLFVGIGMDAQQFIWFEAPLRYTLVNVLDHVAEWFVAGLAIAGVVKGRDNL